jgi:hypothetical protein
MPHNLGLTVLQNHYHVVLCLRDYLTQICDPNLVLQKPNDTESYRSLLTTSYVAFPESIDASKEVTFKTGHVMSEMYEVGKPQRLAELYC